MQIKFRPLCVILQKNINYNYYGLKICTNRKMTSNVLPWPVCKKPKLENDESKQEVDDQPKPPRVKKRMFALLVAYCGQGYAGLQRNAGMKTIEEDIMVALKNIGAVNEEEFKRQRSVNFQRAARTDKGVSALRQMLSLEMRENVKPEELNEHLPEQIRVLAVRRVTKGFNSKNTCDSRTYSYTCPTFAFAPKDTPISEDYRISNDALEKLTEPIKMFIGTHNYHNFTSGRRPLDPSCNRYMMDITYRPPIVREGLELITFMIKGQSFMMHQIRKMMAALMGVTSGYLPADFITTAYNTTEKLDIGVAPGVGLLLEQVHYDWYNGRYGADGFHDRLDFLEIEPLVEEFREKQIYPWIIKAEKEEKSMENWLNYMREQYSFSETLSKEANVQTSVDQNEAGTSNSNSDVSNGSKQDEHTKDDIAEADTIVRVSESEAIEDVSESKIIQSYESGTTNAPVKDNDIVVQEKSSVI